MWNGQRRVHLLPRRRLVVAAVAAGGYHFGQPSRPRVASHWPLTTSPAMKFDRLIALLPSQSLEDFDLGRRRRTPSSCWRPGRPCGIPLLLAGQPGRSRLDAGRQLRRRTRRAIWSSCPTARFRRCRPIGFPRPRRPGPASCESLAPIVGDWWRPGPGAARTCRHGRMSRLPI